MKIFYTMFSILLLATVFVSCSKETDTEYTNDSEALSVYTPAERSEGFNYYEATQRIQDDMAQNGQPMLPLTQGAIDHYLDVAGYEGTLDAETVSRLNDEVKAAQDLGLERYLENRLQVDEFTKNTLLEITEKGPKNDITSHERFRELPKKERKMILGANEIAKSFYENGRMNRTNGTGDSIIGAVTYGVAGFAAGMGFCGVPCGVVGGVIGAVWGWFTGADGQK